MPLCLCCYSSSSLCKCYCSHFNLLLFVSMVIYLDNVENSMILSISFLVANIIVSVFLNREIFFTSLIQGFVDCLLGLQDRYFHYNTWFVCSMVHCCIHIISRFCWLLFAFTYLRHSKRAVIGLTVSSWVISLVTGMIFLAIDAVVFAVSILWCAWLPSVQALLWKMVKLIKYLHFHNSQTESFS